MANFTRNFTAGRMNKVVDERLVPDGEYIDAMNIRMGSTENSEIGVIENTKGNIPLTELTYIDGTPLSTEALCIGAIADTAEDTLYWFVHDPAFTSVTTGKLDLIVSYNISTNILTYHIVSVNDGFDTITTLNFNPQYLITGVNKVGDLLFFTDNYNAPRFIDVRKNYPNPVGDIDNAGNPDLLRESILVIKKPPTESPGVQLIVQGDQNNYLEERFICFAYRYKYVNGEYSATSQWSQIAFLPNTFSFSPNTYLNEGMTNNFNAAIVSYNTGGPLVVGIDLLFKQANNNIIKVIEKLDKALLGIPDNTTQTFSFNSSKIFTVLSEGEILRLYDNVPLYAKAQTIMGNRLMYGNYIEGYDLIDKYGNPTRLEYETELVSQEIGFDNLTTELTDGDLYTIQSPSQDLFSSAITVYLIGVPLTAGSSITIELTFNGVVINPTTLTYLPFAPNPAQPPTPLTFSFTLAIDYPSVYAMVTSPEFQNTIGTAFNILPVYSPIPGDQTSCDGGTLTDSLNCAFVSTILNTTTGISYVKYESGITGPNEPIALLDVAPGNQWFTIQLVAMRYVDDPSNITHSACLYPLIIDAEAYFQKVSSPGSLHSNRDYEIGIVYMDEFNRATTALVSPNNTEHIPCRYSVNQNSIKVTIPTSQRAPSWAKRFKFVCKADAENYETIYSNIFFTQAGTSDVYFLLEGENMRKVEIGDRYIVKRDTGGALLNCAYATVLDKGSKSSGFITTTSGVTPPAGVYMKMKPDEFQADQPPLAVINPGTITTNENTEGEYPIQFYPMNIETSPGVYTDYTVPAGSVIVMYFKFQRLGSGDGDNKCERRIYTLEVTLVSSALYANMYDWWVGDNVASVLNSGTQEVGGSNCAINNVFQLGFGTPSTDLCTNYFRFDRDAGTNQLWLKISGTVRCQGPNADKRRSSITSKITVFRADAMMVFETFPTDTLPDVFFENNLSFPIDNEGNHLSNGGTGDISQDIAGGINGEFQTGFFNCFAFGNAVESYKVRDSLIGRTFNLGERITTVAAQDYKEARRFADITYSGVYNQETNVNKLNEFNMGLLNFKNLETSFGDVQILDGRETDVLVLQEDKISYVLAGKNLLSDAAAGGVITSVPEVLGTQIARVEKYGISFNPESYVQWGYDRFFTDVKRGAVIQMKGDSMSQDQLAVVSEANMRTWFRDEFINSFNTQKLGGYDPYMNEYVLSSNDRELPGNPQCLSCGLSQTFNIATKESEYVTNYCVDLNSAIGLTTISWTVSAITPGTNFEINAIYNGNTYGSGITTGNGSFDFNKDSIIETTVAINIIVTGSVTLTLTVDCPLEEELNVVEVVITADGDSGKTIHAEYRYIDGVFVGPLQSSSVVFQTGTDPVVSRYNAITGPVGTGAFPTEGSTLVIQTNKIPPDTFNFDPLGNKFKYLRTNLNYTNTPANIASLLAASSVATPITGGPNIYQTNFIVPPSINGNYLYLIWDLRNSGISNLCYAPSPATTEQLQALCCDCGPCTEACISLEIVNLDRSNPADVHFPMGLCGESTPVTITFGPGETGTVCVNNQEYYVTSGNVTITLAACGCTPCTETCKEYVVWANNGAAQVIFESCGGSVVTLPVANGTAGRFCVAIDSALTAISGNPQVYLTNPCGCCADNDCVTWEVTNTASGPLSFDARGCDDFLYTYTLQAFETIQLCIAVGDAPINPNAKLEFTVISSCGCTAPYPCTSIQTVSALATNNMVLISPLGTLPLVYQCTGWGIGSGGNHTGRFFNLNNAPSNPTGLVEGETYYVTMELSVPIPRDMGLWFGRTTINVNSNADLIIPIGSTFISGNLVWNTGSTLGYFTKSGSNLSPGWDGVVTITISKGNCAQP